MKLTIEEKYEKKLQKFKDALKRKDKNNENWKEEYELKIIRKYEKLLVKTQKSILTKFISLDPTNLKKYESRAMKLIKNVDIIKESINQHFVSEYYPIEVKEKKYFYNTYGRLVNEKKEYCGYVIIDNKKILDVKLIDISILKETNPLILKYLELKNSAK